MDDMLPFDGLRGICAMAIFLGHQTDMILASPFPHQTVVVGIEYLQAVSLFFLLSGIPLARLYSSTGKVSTWKGTYDFWQKRFARLAPMYYLTLVLNLLVIYAFAEKIDEKALWESFFGCAFFLQGWFTTLIDVGGVLWQVAVFAFAYALFPFLSTRISTWSSTSLISGFFVLWIFSTGIFCAVFALPAADREWDWWIWHVHCASRLPQFLAGVLLGQLVEVLKNDPSRNSNAWAVTADVLSVVLLATAVQAPVVQALYGTDLRTEVSIGLEAFLLPVHAVWLAAIVLACPPCDEDRGADAESGDAGSGAAESGGGWTRRVLVQRPLVWLGEVSLVVYCLHLVVLFAYTALLAYLRTGSCILFTDFTAVTLRVQAEWWHAPLQWALVLVVAAAVAAWFEAPMRRALSASRGAAPFTAEQHSQGGVERLREGGREGGRTAPEVDEEAAPLLPVG